MSKNIVTLKNTFCYFLDTIRIIVIVSLALIISVTNFYEKKNSKQVKFFEIEKVLTKRFTKKRDIEYLVRWTKYEFEENVWKSFSKLENVLKLVKEFETKSFLRRDETW